MDDFVPLKLLKESKSGNQTIQSFHILSNSEVVERIYYCPGELRAKVEEKVLALAIIYKALSLHSFARQLLQIRRRKNSIVLVYEHCSGDSLQNKMLSGNLTNSLLIHLLHTTLNVLYHLRQQGFAMSLLSSKDFFIAENRRHPVIFQGAKHCMRVDPASQEDGGEIQDLLLIGNFIQQIVENGALNLDTKTAEFVTSILQAPHLGGEKSTFQHLFSQCSIFFPKLNIVKSDILHEDLLLSVTSQFHVSRAEVVKAMTGKVFDRLYCFYVQAWLAKQQKMSTEFVVQITTASPTDTVPGNYKECLQKLREHSLRIRRCKTDMRVFANASPTAQLICVSKVQDSNNNNNNNNDSKTCNDCALCKHFQQSKSTSKLSSERSFVRLVPLSPGVHYRDASPVYPVRSFTQLTVGNHLWRESVKQQREAKKHNKLLEVFQKTSENLNSSEQENPELHAPPNTRNSPNRRARKGRGPLVSTSSVNPENNSFELRRSKTQWQWNLSRSQTLI